MKKRIKHIPATLLVLAITSFGMVACSNASTDTTNKQNIITNSNQDVVSNLQTHLSDSGIETNVTSAIPTQVEGLYWVTAEDMPPFYTDKTGKHIIQGQIIAIDGAQPIDISAEFTQQLAKDKLAKLAKEDMIIYPATTDTKAVVYVFTDPTCPYCKKLHKEVEQTNALGIEVRYLAWPRNQQALPIMQNIWCSTNRQQALTDAKQDKTIQAQACESSAAIKEQIALGLSLGVHGTPALFTEDGRQIGGYLSPTDIAKAAISQ